VKRRQFIVALGGVAATWPVAARAQQPAKLPTTGFLVPGTPESHGKWVAAFAQRLSELGWIEGRTVAIEYRWAEGRNERMAEIAAEFVRLKVDVIVTSGNGAIASRQATSVIPIVFAAYGDPVADGIVASLARPGGNVTGLTVQSTAEIAGKRLDLLREVVPGFRRLSIMANVGRLAYQHELGELQAAVSRFGLEATILEIRRAEDIAPAFEAVKNRTDALYVFSEPLTNANRVKINTLALGARIPTIFGFREFVDAGGLMSYGPNFADLFQHAADFVDKILRGAKPADLPVQQPTKFDLIVNLTTAKALGLSIPESFLLRADEVMNEAARVFRPCRICHGHVAARSARATTRKNSSHRNSGDGVVIVEREKSRRTAARLARIRVRRKPELYSGIPVGRWRCRTVSGPR
jgi:putative ABC transport system substrate-binding protein